MENFNNETLKFNEICRICLTKTTEMVALCKNDEYPTSLITMLSSLGNFDVVIDDDFPQFICNDCEDKLRFSYEFQQLIKRNHEFFLQNSTIKQKQTVEDYVDDDDDDQIIEQKIRLQPIPPEIVKQAIEKTKQTSTNNLNCIKCGHICSNNRALIMHVSYVHKDLRDHWCSTCNQEVENVQQHNKTKHQLKNEYKCEFCSKKFTKKNYLTVHLRSHSALRLHKCPRCKQTFTTASNLRTHQRKHIIDKPYRCLKCSRDFTLKISLKLHLKNHHNMDDDDDHCENVEENIDKQCLEPRNFCIKCNKRVRSLELHQKKFHKEHDEDRDEDDDKRQEQKQEQQQDKFLCTLCGKQFKTTSKLKIHMRVHTGETPYKCQYCDKRFVSRGDLVVHERVHTGERPHVCNFCGKAFAQTSVLNTHMKIHTGRPEVCHLCSKRFCRPAQLKLHLRSHTGEKPYLCSQCGQDFYQKSHLVEHQKRHSDERPYICHYCNRGFKHKSILKTHIQIHSGYKPFQCSHCPYACRNNYRLSQHMKQHEIKA